MTKEEELAQSGIYVSSIIVSECGASYETAQELTDEQTAIAKNVLLRPEPTEQDRLAALEVIVSMLVEV